jgi:hypothetical protein
MSHTASVGRWTRNIAGLVLVGRPARRTRKLSHGRCHLVAFAHLFAEPSRVGRKHGRQQRDPHRYRYLMLNCLTPRFVPAVREVRATRAAIGVQGSRAALLGEEKGEARVPLFTRGRARERPSASASKAASSAILRGGVMARHQSHVAVFDLEKTFRAWDGSRSNASPPCVGSEPHAL